MKIKICKFCKHFHPFTLDAGNGLCFAEKDWDAGKSVPYYMRCEKFQHPKPWWKFWE